MFKLVDKKIKNEINSNDYQNQYNSYIEEFEEYEKEFYLNSYETEESETKNNFIKEVNNNLEFMKYELE
ncbi:MAG: hypothetical protein E7Z84_03805 [Methanosphaera stadtmanae]|nr:hypothetical protein [Methanosphaera stadtmanae]